MFRLNRKNTIPALSLHRGFIYATCVLSLVGERSALVYLIKMMLGEIRKIQPTKQNPSPACLCLRTRWTSWRWTTSGRSWRISHTRQEERAEGKVEERPKRRSSRKFLRVGDTASRVALTPPTSQSPPFIKYVVAVAPYWCDLILKNLPEVIAEFAEDHSGMRSPDILRSGDKRVRL